MREYNFTLPLIVSGMYKNMLVNMISNLKTDDGNHVWYKLPQTVKNKLGIASKSYNGVLEITKDDLDAIPDEIWIILKREIVDRYLS